MKHSRVFLQAAVLVPLLAASTFGANFIRGDSNVDGNVDMSDAIFTLNVLFLGAAPADCDDASDTNNDGKIDISDGVYLLNFLFLGGTPISPPFPDCGGDADGGAIGCNTYPFCEEPVDCFEQEDLDAIIAENVASSQCIPAGSADTTVGNLEISACPVDGASPCGDDQEPGCAVEFTTLEATLDIAGRNVSIHLEGSTDLPIFIKDTVFGTETTCDTHVEFSGDIVIPFTTSDNGDGTLTVTSLEPPTVENPDVSLDASGGLLCSLLASQQDQLIPQIIEQLESAAADIVAELEPEVVGQVLCP